jgi:hypothetical protein
MNDLASATTKFPVFREPGNSSSYALWSPPMDRIPGQLKFMLTCNGSNPISTIHETIYLKYNPLQSVYLATS